MIGTTIGNYEIKSLLGEGGMGNVYLAVHTQLGRKVAIKSLHQQLVKNEGLRARFKQEANTMAHLQHNGIVTLFDYVEDERGLFLIMEFVEGTQLDEYIRNVSGPIPAERAVPILNDILDAFAYAHEKGVVHRDIKPSNILITNDGKVKILDFGIAKMLSDSGNKLTKTGTQMGTVFYMSPEQVQGKEVDIRSDIYSLGITFYQMLTGVSPYDGMTTEFEVYSKIVAEPLPSANATYPGVPAALDLIIAKATAKKKEDRFQTCREFLSFLKNPSEQIPNSISQTTIVENKQLNETVHIENPSAEILQLRKSLSPLQIILISVGVFIVLFLGTVETRYMGGLFIFFLKILLSTFLIATFLITILQPSKSRLELQIILISVVSIGFSYVFHRFVYDVTHLCPELGLGEVFGSLNFPYILIFLGSFVFIGFYYVFPFVFYIISSNLCPELGLIVVGKVFFGPIFLGTIFLVTILQLKKSRSPLKTILILVGSLFVLVFIQFFV